MSRFHAVLAVIIALAILCLVMMAQAFAQTPCGDRAGIVKMLAEKYREQVMDRGLIPSQQQVLEVFASPAGTWTILISRPSGLTCIMAAGEGFKRLNPAPLKPTGQEL